MGCSAVPVMAADVANTPQAVAGETPWIDLGAVAARFTIGATVLKVTKAVRRRPVCYPGAVVQQGDRAADAA